ncbi:MAG: flagellar export chaperone FlgN [Phycisphaeraceae bacterium]|nr:flagellar export chaperone FlgN [Phycisphaeraceae bacterium]
MTTETAQPDAYENPRTWVPRISRLLDRQLGLYARLDELSKSQTAHIERDETDELLAVLSRRQSVIEDITKVNEELGPFRDRWQSLSGALDEREKGELRSRLEALESLVDAIAQRDDADRRALESRRQRVGTELSGLTRGRGAMNAYQKDSRGAGPKYQDRRG